MAGRLRDSEFKADLIRLEKRPRSHRLVPLLFIAFCTISAPLAVSVWACSGLFNLNKAVLIQREAALYPSVDGILTGVRWGQGKRAGIHPTYRFTVNGTEYTGTHYRYLQPWDSSACRTIGESLSAQVGGEVPVYYDPRDPTTSLLDPTPEPGGLVWSRFILQCFFLGVALMVLVVASGAALYQVLRGMVRPCPPAPTGAEPGAEVAP